MPASRVNKRSVLRLERERRALELRRQGYRYDEIAAALGISVVGAWKIVQSAYKRTLQQCNEEVEINRRLDLERLEMALTRLWPNINANRGWAYERLLGILERRAKLLGLDMPARQETDIGDTLAQVLERLANSSGTANN